MTEARGEIRPLAVALHGRPFAAFPLHPTLLETLEKNGFTKSTIIQDLFLPQALKGHDAIVKARRGSGKALAYIIVILDRLLREEPKGLHSLVLVTNPERALELTNFVKGLARDFPFSATAFASADKIPEDQLKAVEKGANVIFTTPHWLNRLLKWKLIPTQQLKVLVLDEFDQMALENKTFLENLLAKLPLPGERQGLVFMENLRYEALETAYKFLKDPDEIYIEIGREDFNELELSLIHVSREEKFMLLLGVLAQHGWQKAIIFVNNKLEAQSLCDELKKIGFRAVFLKPDLGPEYRLRFLKQFAGQDADILIATDAGCRFIQQDGVPLLINYDLPESAEEFRQRALKVADNGKIISFCDEDGAFYLEFIEKDLGFKIPVIFPEPEDKWFLSPVIVKEMLSKREKSLATKRQARPRAAKQQKKPIRPTRRPIKPKKPGP
ncbi:DEAD/DEAH box helicase [Thermodesulfatator atlanticus]|uniref:DEAD/DEAH box helicase n=1 Tax=Thermodesulfatator atlanticus TaxID=501497 RepID=UPI0003B2FBEA|nr:DEAD/DEAH box helicase [Thermodesulfatator atlanticus]